MFCEIYYFAFYLEFYVQVYWLTVHNKKEKTCSFIQLVKFLCYCIILTQTYKTDTKRADGAEM